MVKQCIKCKIIFNANEYMKYHIFELRRKMWRHSWSYQLYTQICVMYTFVKSNSWPLWYRCSAIFYHLRVKELTKWPNPSWLDSSVDRALHWYRRGHAFEFRLDLNCITAMINYAFAIFTYSHIRYFWLANTPSGKSLIRFEFRYLWKQCMYSKSLN